MFERFTDSARRVVVLAQEQARDLQHDSIGTEHLLLGLLAQDQHSEQDVPLQVLGSLDVTFAGVRRDVERLVGAGEQPPSGHIPFTPRAKRVLELGSEEALQLDHAQISTEHLLLGMIRQGEGTGVQILTGLGLDRNLLRTRVLDTIPDTTSTIRQPGGRADRLEQIEDTLAHVLLRLDALEQRLGDQ